MQKGYVYCQCKRTYRLSMQKDMQIVNSKRILYSDNVQLIWRMIMQMNNYIVRAYRDVIVVIKLQQGDPVKHRV